MIPAPPQRGVYRARHFDENGRSFGYAVDRAGREASSTQEYLELLLDASDPLPVMRPQLVGGAP